MTHGRVLLISRPTVGSKPTNQTSNRFIALPFPIILGGQMCVKPFGIGRFPAIRLYRLTNLPFPFLPRLVANRFNQQAIRSYREFKFPTGQSSLLNNSFGNTNSLRVRSLITFEFAVAGLLTVPPKLILNEPLELPILTRVVIVLSCSSFRNKPQLKNLRQSV